MHHNCLVYFVDDDHYFRFCCSSDVVVDAIVSLGWLVVLFRYLVSAVYSIPTAFLPCGLSPCWYLTVCLLSSFGFCAVFLLFWCCLFFFCLFSSFACHITFWNALKIFDSFTINNSQSRWVENVQQTDTNGIRTDLATANFHLSLTMHDEI